MKTINVAFEDKEYEIISKLKGDLSWRDFIIGFKTANKTKK